MGSRPGPPTTPASQALIPGCNAADNCLRTGGLRAMLPANPLARRYRESGNPGRERLAADDGAGNRVVTSRNETRHLRSQPYVIRPPLPSFSALLTCCGARVAGVLPHDGQWEPADLCDGGKGGAEGSLGGSCLTPAGRARTLCSADGDWAVRSAPSPSCRRCCHLCGFCRCCTDLWCNDCGRPLEMVCRTGPYVGSLEV